MEQTVESLRHSLRQLNSDLVRITEILALNPNSITKLRPKLKAVSEAIKEVHSTLDELEPEDSPTRTIRHTRPN
jgi:Leucine-rich repeat (LRR) protein